MYKRYPALDGQRLHARTVSARHKGREFSAGLGSQAMFQQQQLNVAGDVAKTEFLSLDE